MWAATTVDKVKPLQELDGSIKALMKCSKQYEIQSMLKCLRENKGSFLAKTQMFEEFGQCVCLSCANKRGAATKGSRVSNQPTQAVSLESLSLQAGAGTGAKGVCFIQAPSTGRAELGHAEQPEIEGPSKPKHNKTKIYYKRKESPLIQNHRRTPRE